MEREFRASQTDDLNGKLWKRLRIPKSWPCPRSPPRPRSFVRSSFVQHFLLKCIWRPLVVSSGRHSHGCQLPASSFSSPAASCRLSVVCTVLSSCCPAICVVLSCPAGWLDYSSANQLSLRLASKLSPFTLLQLLLLPLLSPSLLLSSLLIPRLAIALARRFIWIIVMIYTEVAVATFGVQLRPDLARLGNELRRGLRV